MKITHDKLELSSSESIPWEDIKTLRLLNNKLALVLTNDQVIELTNLLPSKIDSAFRAYDKFLKEHPDRNRKRPTS